MIAPTVDIDAEADRMWDVAIVGAGPAGAIAALETARRGVSVLLVDRADFPRSKVCGCCLNAAAIACLEDAGLSTVLAPARSVERLDLAADGCVAPIRLGPMVALSRRALDAAIVRHAIGENAAFLPRTSAALAGAEEDHLALSLRGPDGTARVRARVVLAADGLGGRLLPDGAPAPRRRRRQPRIGLSARLADPDRVHPPGVLRMACANDGYVGTVTLEDGGTALAAAVDPDLVRRLGGPASACSSIIEDAGFVPPTRIGCVAWSGTPRLAQLPGPVSAHRMLAVGDAAGFVEPFTGEGIAWALASGRVAAAIAVRAIQGDADWPDVATTWERRHRALLGARHARCRRLTRQLQRPRLTRAAVRVIRAVPALAGPLVRSLGTPLDTGPGRP